jgi:DNA polymerase-3 subunit beta
MKVTILPENITNYIPLLNKILPSHSQVPILSNIFIEAKSDGLTLKATDLEMGTEIKIPAKIEEEGAVTVPGKEFLEAIGSLPKDKIEIEVDKDIMNVKCRDTKVVFNTISKDEFPILYKGLGEKIADFTREEFLDIFSNLTFSVSMEDSRPQLMGVLINPVDSGVDFVSTDGYRMSVRKIGGKKTEEKEGVIVAVKLINEVIALKGEGSIVLYLNKNEGQVVFEIGDVIIVGRMIEGAFPDYGRVIPKESTTTVNFEREALLQGVKLVSVFAKDSSNIAMLSVEDKKIVIETKTQGVGEGKAVVECEKSGEDVKIAFNIRYLMDILRNVSDKTMILKLNSNMEPALFELEKKGFSHVIMPIQVDN